MTAPKPKLFHLASKARLDDTEQRDPGRPITFRVDDTDNYRRRCTVQLTAYSARKLAESLLAAAALAEATQTLADEHLPT